MLVTGLRMTDMAGLEMMAAMKRAYGTVKPFVVSGGDEEELQEAKSMAAQAVWPKPFSLQEFLSAVQNEIGAGGCWTVGGKLIAKTLPLKRVRTPAPDAYRYGTLAPLVS